jgi:hypothetical protein
MAPGFVTRTWEDEVRALYVRSEISVEEFEELLDVALRGERPDHPDLPVFLLLPLTMIRR